MRILHALAQRPGRTGSGVFLQELFKAGHEKGYEQAVLAGIPLSQSESNVDNLQKENFFPVYFESTDLPFPVAGMSDLMPYNSTKYSDIDEQMYELYEKAFKAKLQEAIESFKPDVVIANHLWLLSSYIKELFPNLKVICLCHGTDLRQSKLSPKLFEIVKQNITKCDYACASNIIQKNNIMKTYGFDDNKAIVVGTGYDPTLFFQTQKPEPKPVKIVYVGKISNAKGVPNLLKAYESLGYTKEEVTLTLIGGGAGSESEAIQKYINTMKSSVNYLGFVEQETLVQSFYNSHIFILPSFYEGLPLVVIEALACGMRVISTRLPGLPEFLGKSFEKLEAISYIDLPKMKSVDEPQDDYVEIFEKEIAHALHLQVERVLKGEKLDIQEIEKNLKDKTWKGLFERLESYM